MTTGNENDTTDGDQQYTYSNMITGINAKRLRKLNT